MKLFIFTVYFIFQFTSIAVSDISISPYLFFLRNFEPGNAQKVAQLSDGNKASVTLQFENPPDYSEISELENHGLTFRRDNGNILHTKHIYLAEADLDSLESLSKFDGIISIESTFKPSLSSTLDISNPLVGASQTWDLTYESLPVDGTGVIIANVDTGIDIYHPAFFKPDGGVYEWIDVNDSGSFENGVDCVDINRNGQPDPDETLRFYDAEIYDYYSLGIMDNPKDIYDADIDWLYNDTNNSGFREYGPENGFNENSPSFGELVFIISDDNGNNSLDNGESITALGTSKVLAIFDSNGKHYRGENLLTSTGDSSNHGTSSFGIAGGQTRGRRFTGMAPGVEFICINHNDLGSDNVFEGILWAKNIGADMIMYEYGSWVHEFLDGSSNSEVFINDLYDDGIHQFTASGNLAGYNRNKHSLISLNSGAQDSLKFSIPEAYNITELYFSFLWRNSTSYLPAITLNISDSDSVFITADSQPYDIGKLNVISGMDYSSKGTARLDIVISSDSVIKGDMFFTLSNLRRIDLDIHCYISDNKTAWTNGAQFQNHLTDNGTVCSPGTAEKGITVGAFYSRDIPYTLGDICYFSSWGETIDGRRGVDITAPGSAVFSPFSNSKTSYQPGGYQNFGGTSAALPHVSGAAALIIQVNKNISPDNLSQLLFESVNTDEFTGLTPNNIWGYGKLNVFDSIKTIYAERAKFEPFKVSNPYPNPFKDTTNFEIDVLNENKSYISCSIYNILGQKIKTMHLDILSDKLPVTWDGHDDNNRPVPSGIYIFRFYIGNFTISKKTLLIQ
ncbi:S8 family serine peptidase [Candidatus Latescibacterota bacterium]